MVQEGTPISRSDDVAWGSVVFAGTRVPVDILFDHIEAGLTIDEFLRQFPTVGREQVLDVLGLAHRLVDNAADERFARRAE
jgi:uncharacterized protein (DUF433 family)